MINNKLYSGRGSNKDVSVWIPAFPLRSLSFAGQIAGMTEGGAGSTEVKQYRENV